MKNICFIDADLSILGGAEKVMLNISKELSKNYNVHLISIWSKNENIPFKIPNSIHCMVLNKGSGRRRDVYLKSFFKLIKYIKKEKIETVFLINTYSASFVSLLKKFLNVKFVFCDHGAVSNELDKKFNMKHRNSASKKCDITVTLTQRNIDDYKTIFKTPASKLVCIPNWISDDVIDVASSKYNIKSKKIITVGRFSKEKGYDMLIDIANEVLKKHPDWTWDIFGDGETFDQVEKSINKYNINDKVLLKGQSNDIYHKYRDYAIYVMTSYREGLPLVLLEAKVNRLPIVSFDCITGPREIITDKLDGFLINCYDKKEMSNKICDLIENDDLRQNFSDNSFNNIEKFNKNHILKKWVEIIENL